MYHHARLLAAALLPALQTGIHATRDVLCAAQLPRMGGQGVQLNPALSSLHPTALPADTTTAELRSALIWCAQLTPALPSLHLLLLLLPRPACPASSCAAHELVNSSADGNCGSVHIHLRNYSQHVQHVREAHYELRTSTFAALAISNMRTSMRAASASSQLQY